LNFLKLLAEDLRRQKLHLQQLFHS
jgi:hypothetical protein